MIGIFATALAAIILQTTPVNLVTQTNFNGGEEYSSYSSEQSITIKTPNGSNARAYRASEDFSDYDKVVYMNYFKNHPEYNLNPETIDVATFAYNSFSYAFYKRWSENAIDCNLYDCTPFLEDKSFIEVNSPSVDDIIVYFTFNEKNGVYEAIHSGIVLQVYDVQANGVCGNANTVYVQSKWGYFGLYQHRGDECPYIAKYNFSDNYINFDVAATKVKYYRRHASHSYTTKVEGSIHTYACKCGDTVEKHSYTKRYVNNGLNHTAYCECGEGKTSFHSYWNRYEKYNMTQHIAYCACGASTKESHNFIVDRFGFKYCSYCKQDDIKEETIHRLNSLPLDDLFDLKDVLLNGDEKIED